ncbi:MAG: GerMN domain-containing protein [Acidimicrobiales bacterium]
MKDRAPYGGAVRTGRSAVAVTGLVALLGLAGAGCGVPVQTRPVALSASQLPAGLTGASTTTTLRGSSTPVSLIQVYFVAGDRLVARSRLVPSPGGLPEALADLLAGPTPAESAAGIRTSIDPSTELLSERVIRNRVVLDLSPTFTDTGGPDQILAIAQFVYTVTGIQAGVTAVSFELGDSPVAVPTANGTLVSAPVSRANYASLLTPASQPGLNGPF